MVRKKMSWIYYKRVQIGSAWGTAAEILIPPIKQAHNSVIFNVSQNKDET